MHFHSDDTCNYKHCYSSGLFIVAYNKLLTLCTLSSLGLMTASICTSLWPAEHNYSQNGNLSACFCQLTQQ